MGDRRPVRYEHQPPAPRDQPRLPAHAAAQAPVHAPRTLEFADSTGTREELWNRLPATVRGKVEARYGKLLEWWADDDETGRITAVALGDRALVTVDPTVNAQGANAYRVAALRLDPSSFRSARVTGPTGENPAGQGGQGTRLGSADRSGQRPQPFPGIEPDLAGLLGYLPVRAQTLLQDPFLAGAGQLDWRYHYLRHGQGLAGARLQLWCYLTDLRTVTFVAGTGYGYRDGAGAEAWQLSCWRASRE